MNSTPPCYRCSTEVGQHSVMVEGVTLGGKPKIIRVCMDCAYPHEVAADQEKQLPKRRRRKRGGSKQRAADLAHYNKTAAEKKAALEEKDKERARARKKERQELEVLMIEMDKHLTVPIAERCLAHTGRKGISWNHGYGTGFEMTETGPLDPLAVVEAYFWKTQGVCYYCREELNFVFHIEHMTPTSRGGTNHRKNITVSCADCNDDKGTMTAAEYTPLYRKPKRKTVLLRKKDGRETRKVLGTPKKKPDHPLKPDEPWWHDPRDIFEDLP